MKRILTTALTVAAAGVLLWQTPRVHAQDAPPPGVEAGPGGPGGSRMEQFRQRMNERVKGQLKASDEEWGIIQPLLETVETKQRETMAARWGGPGGAFGGGGRGPRQDNNGPGGPANGGGAEQPRPERAGRPPERRGSPEAQALNDALQADSNAADMKAKLAALREQRKKSEAELGQAREDLKKVLNLRQEATLVLMGILD